MMISYNTHEVHTLLIIPSKYVQLPSGVEKDKQQKIDRMITLYHKVPFDNIKYLD